MTATIINEEAIEILITKLDSFVWTDKDFQEREALGEQFLETFKKNGLKIWPKKITSQVLGANKAVWLMTLNGAQEYLVVSKAAQNISTVTKQISLK